jgi:hypothetical protein
MPPDPIRGWWTLARCRVCDRAAMFSGGLTCDCPGPKIDRHVEVVPVPDKQAIERGEHEYDRAVARGEDHHKAFRRGLAAALEQPE